MIDLLFFGFDDEAYRSEVSRLRGLLTDAAYAESVVVVRIGSTSERLVSGSPAPFIELRGREFAVSAIQRDLRERLQDHYTIANGQNTLWLQPITVG